MFTLCANEVAGTLTKLEHRGGERKESSVANDSFEFVGLVRILKGVERRNCVAHVLAPRRNVVQVALTPSVVLLADKAARNTASSFCGDAASNSVRLSLFELLGPSAWQYNFSLICFASSEQFRMVATELLTTHRILVASYDEATSSGVMFAKAGKNNAVDLLEETFSQFCIRQLQSDRAEDNSLTSSILLHNNPTPKVRVTERKQLATNYSVEFAIHESVIGSIIGKQGENLAKLSKKYKAEIKVLPAANGTRVIRINSYNAQNNAKVREEIEYLYYRFEFPSAAVLQEIEAFFKSEEFEKNCLFPGLHSAWSNASNNELYLCGLKRGLQKAINSLNQFLQDRPVAPHSQSAF